MEGRGAVLRTGAEIQDGPAVLMLWHHGPPCATAQGVVENLTSDSPSRSTLVSCGFEGGWLDLSFLGCETARTAVTGGGGCRDWQGS